LIEEKSGDLLLEAEAFDNQIQERVAAGHIPDLRCTKECTYFYNNTWRHPDYVRLDFGEQFELIRKAIGEYAEVQGGMLRVLEVGCGPGYISLELARNGYDTTGIDLSKACIDIAKDFAKKDPWSGTRGPLAYLCGDFYVENLLQSQSFDAVIFVGALHHFSDQEKVGKRVQTLLKENGLIIVHEPTRDRVTRGNATFIHLVRLLLAQGGGFYKDTEIPENFEVHSAEIDAIFSEMRYESQSGENVQSVNDNEAGFLEMNKMLQKHFVQLCFRERYAFFHELIGGLRYEQSISSKLARYLRDADAELCRLGVLQPTEFFYTGRNKGDG
jgi:2-polyprenyl-3-methyl-5-hydroxy-6-metoxy-1,4-benzoquinol methylase